jgi:hypothetical protein
MSAYAEVLPRALMGLGPDGLMGELSRLMGKDAGKLFDATADRMVRTLPAERPELDGPEESGLQLAS